MVAVVQGQGSFHFQQASIVGSLAFHGEAWAGMDR